MHLFFWYQKLKLFKNEVERVQLLNLVVFTPSISVDAFESVQNTVGASSCHDLINMHEHP